MRVGAPLAGGVLLFLIVEALVFRTGYYTSLLEPESSAGHLVTLLWNEQARPKTGASQVPQYSGAPLYTNSLSRNSALR